MFNRWNLVSAISLVWIILIVQNVSETSGAIHFKKGSPMVKLANNGVISGKVFFSRDGRPYNAFIGIPYATIPERFAEAQLVTEANWEGTKAAVSPGPLCTQTTFVSDDQLGVRTFGEENCLNLNVYVPMNNTGKKGFPVMVWMHGGGLMFGGGFGYGPNFFMDEDVIVVTMNYRLGVFGFLSTGDSIIPGNNGLKDATLSLQWVQQNIKNFGGDPDKVTIFGESAGGAVVSYLLLSPKTTGLFHRVIAQSGSALESWSYYPNPKDVAVKLATHMKCSTTSDDPTAISSEEILTCLRKATMEELNTAQFSFRTSWPLNMANFFFGPTHEDEVTSVVSSVTPFITQSPFDMLADKNLPIAEVPLMIGMTEDEGAPLFAGVIMKNKKVLEDLNTNWNDIIPKALSLSNLFPKEEIPAVTEKLRKFYFDSKPVSDKNRVGLTDIYSDFMISYGIYRSAVQTASRGKNNRVYLYQYAHHGIFSLMGTMVPCAEEETKKVGHGDEVIYQFDMSQMSPGGGGEQQNIFKDTPEHETFSKNFVKLWVSFATHGEPKYSWGNSAARKWKAISRKELAGEYPMRWYRIEANPSQIEDPYKERMTFLDQLFKDHLISAEKQGIVDDSTKKTEL